MKKVFLAFCFLFTPVAALAAGGNENVDKVYIDLGDKASLQRGARTFVNYCLSCHSAAFMRYNRMGEDLGISVDVVRDNMMFAADKVGELMTINMDADDAKKWFGVVPPDLSVTSRSRGPDWIYTYLRGFYVDESTVTGWNNSLFPNVAMPHIMYEWQGLRKAVHGEVDGHDAITGFETIREGTMSEREFDSAMRDLTNFMVYLGEPAQLHRYTIGFWVTVFLLILAVLTYALKKEFWRDLH